MPRITRGGVALGAEVLSFAAIHLFGGHVFGAKSRSGAPPSVPASDWQHPVALVSVAATEHAAGDADAVAAWVALGRIMLDTSWLGRCPN